MHWQAWLESTFQGPYQQMWISNTSSFNFFILWTCVCDVDFSGNTFQWTYEIEILLQQVNDISSSQLKIMLRKQIPRYLQFSQEVCFSFLLYRNKKQTVLLTRYKYSHQKRLQITRLTHSFLIQPFSTPWKEGGRERVNWGRIG